MRAFKALDPEKKGYLDAEYLGNLLSTRGEAFSSQETSAMLRWEAVAQHFLLVISSVLPTLAQGICAACPPSVHIPSAYESDDLYRDKGGSLQRSLCLTTVVVCSCASEAATGRIYYEDFAYKLATNGRKV